MGLTAVAAGAAAAALHGNLELIPVSLCIIFSLFAQLSINFCHRYNDSKYEFGENIEDGILPAARKSRGVQLMLKESTYAMLIMACMAGLTLCAMGGWWMMLLGITLTVLAVALYLGPHPLTRSPWGILITWLAYGPISTIAVCLVQSQHESSEPINWFDLGPALMFGCACGFLVANWKIIHNYVHIDADRKYGKHSFTLTIGRKASRAVVFINALLAFGIMWAYCLMDIHNGETWILIVMGIGVVAYAVISLMMGKSTTQQLHNISSAAGILMFLLFLAIFIIACATGKAFDTHLTIIGNESII